MNTFISQKERGDMVSQFALEDRVWYKPHFWNKRREGVVVGNRCQTLTILFPDGTTEWIVPEELKLIYFKR